MEHFVTLDRLPEGLSIPHDLADRFRFDSARRRLVYQGFMSKGTFDRLVQLSPDWSYRRALEELFRISTDDDDASRPGLGKRLRALAASLRLL